MSCSQPLPSDHPMSIAWEKFTKTAEYENAVRWAVYPQHVSGSLWAAFVAGFEQPTVVPCEKTKHPDSMASQQFVDGWNACREAMRKGVPVDAVVLPKYPTEAMIEAAIAVHRNDCERPQTGRGALVCMMYHAMLEAARETDGKG